MHIIARAGLDDVGKAVAGQDLARAGGAGQILDTRARPEQAKAASAVRISSVAGLGQLADDVAAIVDQIDVVAEARRR